MDDQERIADLERRLRDAEDSIKKCSEEEMYLQQAADTQRSILPDKAPIVAGYDIAAMMQPARGVGGDFFDYFPNFSGPDTLGILAGDISDKGVPAALYMSLTHGMVHAGLSLHNKFTADKLLYWLNTRLLEISKSNMFVTMTYGVLDSNDNTFSFARAGHTQPLLFNKEGRVTYCGDAKSGQPLGILPHPDIGHDTIEVPPGHLIMIYSDGVTDETNPESEEYGIFRLMQTVSDSRKLPAEGICQSVMESLENYRGGTHQDDDCTIMIIKRNE
jgi:phosphoserine phosphatase RsbU/P